MAWQKHNATRICARSPEELVPKIVEHEYRLEYQYIFDDSDVSNSRGQHMQKVDVSIPRIPPVKKAAKAETVTLRHLALALAESHGMKKAQTTAMLTDMVEVIAKHLKKGKRIRLNGLGILQVRKRPARMGRNPATGEAIKIKASKKVAFRAAKELKAAV
jgi:DNA-binding protein HU-beta